MSVKKRDQQNYLAFSDCFTIQNLLFYVLLKFPRCIAISFKSKVDPQIQKSQTVEALNVKKSVNQSEKAVRAGFSTEIEQYSIRLQKQAPVEI